MRKAKNGRPEVWIVVPPLNQGQSEIKVSLTQLRTLLLTAEEKTVDELAVLEGISPQGVIARLRKLRAIFGAKTTIGVYHSLVRAGILLHWLVCGS